MASIAWLVRLPACAGGEGEWTGWDTEGPDDRRVNLERKLPVYVVYCTTCMKNGEPYFGNDLYDRDEAVVEALTGAAMPRPEETWEARRLQLTVGELLGGVDRRRGDAAGWSAGRGYFGARGARCTLFARVACPNHFTLQEEPVNRTYRWTALVALGAALGAAACSNPSDENANATGSAAGSISTDTAGSDSMRDSMRDSARDTADTTRRDTPRNP